MLLRFLTSRFLLQLYNVLSIKTMFASKQEIYLNQLDQIIDSIFKLVTIFQGMLILKLKLNSIFSLVCWPYEALIFCETNILRLEEV